MARFIDQLKRTHYCGELRMPNAGNDVVLYGWVSTYRDHGGCVFIDLRDRSGVTQIVFDKSVDEDLHALADSFRNEWVVGVSGAVRDRGEQRNPRMETGDIEVLAAEATVFNQSKTPPFEVSDDTRTAEENRLKYRFVDLRRPVMQRNLMMRHRVSQATRRYFDGLDFVEVETPFIVKYTPGGARNFIVPSRLHPGSFYALAESPQLYKQMLMVSGYDRYFQIVKCFRDEDLRIDRQPEFTQIDVEMSFINQEDLFKTVEGLMFQLFQAGLDLDLHTVYPDGTFPRLDYYEAMDKYGSDKPDLRFGLPHTDITALIVEHKGGKIPFFEPLAQKFIDGEYRLDLPREIVKAMIIPAAAAMSRKDVDGLEEFVKRNGGTGLGRAKVDAEGNWTQSPLKKWITDELRTAINDATGAQEGDLIVLQSGPYNRVQTSMANLRPHVAKMMGLIPESGSGGTWNLSWVVAPPLFEAHDDGSGWAAAHHAFTRPFDEDIALIETDPGKVRCYRYDLVLNGFEIAGGSIRLHDPEVQAQVFATLGINEEERERLFGFLLNALSYGAPPHGGIALGMDRIIMNMAETDSIRDVVAFPKTQKGTCLLTGSPDPVSNEQLEDVHIRAVIPQK